jgi:hypothetical protein
VKKKLSRRLQEKIGPPLGRFLIGFQREVYPHLLSGYDRPRDLRYFFVFLSPIRDAFFFTVSVDRPNLAATLAVGLFGKSFFSKLISLFDHKPLTSFFFAIA